MESHHFLYVAVVVSAVVQCFMAYFVHSFIKRFRKFVKRVNAFQDSLVGYIELKETKADNVANNFYKEVVEVKNILLALAKSGEEFSGGNGSNGL